MNELSLRRVRSRLELGEGLDCLSRIRSRLQDDVEYDRKAHMAGNGGPLEILGLSAQWNSLSSTWMADTQSMAISLGVLFTFFFMWNQAVSGIFMPNPTS